MLVQCLTDNKNRTAAEVRSIFTKCNGAMAGAGSVAWMFEKKGLIVVKAANTTEEKLMDVVLSAGAQDMSQADENFEVITNPHEFEAVREALKQAGISVESAQITMIPKNQVTASPESARAVLRLIEQLEDQDDVQNVYANCDIPEEVLKEIG